jgi:hypothetical protein
MGAQQRKFVGKQSKTKTVFSALERKSLVNLHIQQPTGEEDTFHFHTTVLCCVGKNRDLHYVLHMRMRLDASLRQNALYEQHQISVNGALPIRFVRNNVQKDSSFVNMKTLTHKDAKSSLVAYIKEKITTIFTAQESVHQYAPKAKL